MRKLIFVLLMMFFFLSVDAQTPQPSGYPLTNSRAWVKYGYVQTDSAFIYASRDTNWRPRFAGSVVWWKRAGLDSLLWIYTGNKWQPVNSVQTYASITELRGAYPLDSTTIYRLVTNNKIISDFYFTKDQSSADDSVMTLAVTGGRLKRYVTDDATVNVTWFGAIADDNIDDYASIQKAVNYAIANQYRRVFIPSGNFRISKGILVWKDANNDGNPEFVNITIEGITTAYGGSSMRESQLQVTNSTNFGLAIMRGKGASVRNLNIVGTNTLNYSVATAWDTATTYIQGSQRTNVYSPYAGLVIDPFGASTTGSNRYPDFENYYAGVSGNGGSTDCKFDNLKIDGFVVGVILTPNSNTQNNEAHVFDGLWLTNCREGFATTNSQERQVTVRNVRSWNSVKTVFDTYTYGLNRGETPNIDGGNIAGNIYQLFNFQGTGGYFPVISVKNFYAEQFYRIGTVIGRTAHFIDCHFALGQTTDFGMKVPNWILNTNGVEFDNSMLLYYNGAFQEPINIIGSGIVKFKGCELGNPVSTFWNQWTDNYPNIIYDNVHFYTMNGNINANYFTSEFSNYSALTSGGQLKFVDFGQDFMTYSYGMVYNGIPTYGSQIRRVKSQIRKWIPLGSVSVTVSGSTATALIPSLAGKTHLIGKLVFDTYQTNDAGMQMMRINNIDGSGNVTFNYVVQRVVTGTYVMWIEDYQKLSVPYMFDYDGSTMTNIYQDLATSGVKTTATLSTGTTYYYNGEQPVLLSSASSGTATPTSGWQPFQSSIKRGVLSDFAYDEWGQTLGNPLTNNYFFNGMMFTENAIYTNTKTTGVDSLIIAYKCVRTGIKGTSVPPEFIEIYRNGYSSLLPAQNTTFNLGSTSFKWNNVYANKFFGYGFDSVATATGGFLFKDYATGEIKLTQGVGGGGSTNTSVGNGFKLAINGTNNIKSLTQGYGILIDSATANEVKITADTTTLFQNSTLYFRNTGDVGNSLLLTVNSNTVGVKKLIQGDGVITTVGDSSITLLLNAYKNTAVLDFPLTPAVNSSDLTITVTGASVGDVVILGVPNGSVTAVSSYSAWVSATNTVTVRFNNYSTGGIDPASGTFKATVLKF